MKFKQIYLLPVICIGVLFTACKKYPENDRIYLRSVKARLKNNTWYFKQLTINGVDSTLNHLHQMLPTSNDAADFWFRFNTHELKLGQDGGEIALGGKFENISFNMRLDDHKKKFYCEPYIYSAIIHHSVFWIYSAQDWDIKKLTDKDFIIETNYAGDIVKMAFTGINN